MGQYEVIDFLRENEKRWYSSVELKEMVPLVGPNAFAVLARLQKNPLVKTTKMKKYESGALRNINFYALNEGCRT